MSMSMFTDTELRVNFTDGVKCISVVLVLPSVITARFEFYGSLPFFVFSAVALSVLQYSVCIAMHDARSLGLDCINGTNNVC